MGCRSASKLQASVRGTWRSRAEDSGAQFCVVPARRTFFAARLRSLPPGSMAGAFVQVPPSTPVFPLVTALREAPGVSPCKQNCKQANAQLTAEAMSHARHPGLEVETWSGPVLAYGCRASIRG